MFGILWGALFLGEAVGWHTLAGAAIVLVGTALVTGFVPRFGRPARRRQADDCQALSIALPPHYRSADVLAFHARDAEGLAEQVSGEHIRKAVLLGGVPVLLDVTLTPGAAAVPHRGRWRTGRRHAGARARGPGQHPGAAHRSGAFAASCAPIRRSRRWWRASPGLRIVQSATVFEALTWAIIGQQINLPFAISLRRTFIGQAGRAHSSGLWCYPEALDVARLDVEALTGRKFSRAKAETLLRVARMVAEGELQLIAGGRSGTRRRRAAGDQGHRAVDGELHAAAGLWVCGLFAGGGCGDSQRAGTLAGEAGKPDRGGRRRGWRGTGRIGRWRRRICGRV